MLYQGKGESHPMRTLFQICLLNICCTSCRLMIEEAVLVRDEVRVLTIFGKALGNFVSCSTCQHESTPIGFHFFRSSHGQTQRHGNVQGIERYGRSFSQGSKSNTSNRHFYFFTKHRNRLSRSYLNHKVS